MKRSPYVNVGKPKYQNPSELMQGVLLVDEPGLEQSDRLFLACLAGHSITEYPHPGNAEFMVACQVKSRQAVNKIEERVCKRHRLAEIITPGGGRELATVYRIRVEDRRFPWPKHAKKSVKKPATPELQVLKEKPATEELQVSEKETRNCEPGNPQLDPRKPATLELHPNLNPNINSEYGEPSARPTHTCAAAPLCEEQTQEGKTKPATAEERQAIRGDFQKQCEKEYGPNWQEILQAQRERKFWKVARLRQTENVAAVEVRSQF
jgi:hypothetical protein